MTAVSYQDDTHFVGAASAQLEAWKDTKASLQRAGHEIVLEKSGIFIPGAAPGGPLSPAAQELASELPLQEEGLKILGTEATRKHDGELVIGKDGISLQTARKRLEACKTFCQEVAALANSGLDPGTRHMAWSILAKSAARALDFDAQLCPPEAMADVLSEAAEAVRGAAQQITALSLDDVSRVILELPGALGGCGLRLLDGEAMAAACYWAAWVRHLWVIKDLAAAMGRPLERIAGQETAKKAQETLAKAQLLADDQGAVQLEAELAGAWQKTRWKQDRSAEQLLDEKNLGQASEDAPRPGRKLLGKLWRGLEARKAQQLHAKLDEYDQTLWYDGGGQGAGAVWTAAQHAAATPQAPVWFSNAHFVLATAARTLALRLPAGATCQLPAAHAGDAHKGSAKCGEPLGQRGQHLWMCKAGPARMRPHKMLARALGALMKLSGGNVDYEREEPGLSTKGADGQIHTAVMDIIVSFPGCPQQHLVDVTVWHAAAKRYAGADPHAKAAAEKRQRYGDAVATISMGTQGRMGAEADKQLQLLARAADAATGSIGDGRRLFLQWKPILERVVQWTQCDIALLSMGKASSAWYQQTTGSCQASLQDAG